MSRERRSHRSSNWKNDSHSYNEQNSVRRLHHNGSEQNRGSEEAIRDFKTRNQMVCAHCGVPIVDLSSAMTDRRSGKAIHFDCALEDISKEEKLAPGDKISYIGQGRFGIIHYENPHDLRHFSIKKIIEWEEKDKEISWRTEMAELFSKVK